MSVVRSKILDDLVITTKDTVRTLLRAQQTDALALYVFYLYTASWQQTDKPKATEAFCMKGLGWGRDKFRKAKRQLKDMALIKDVRRTDAAGKFIKGEAYIEIDYIKPGANEGHQRRSQATENPSSGLPYRLKNQPPDFQLAAKEPPPNAYVVNKNKEEIHQLNNINPKTGKTVFEKLLFYRVHRAVIQDWLSRFSLDHLEQRVAYLEYERFIRNTDIDNPAGWLRRAVEHQDFMSPPGYEHFREQRLTDIRKKIQNNIHKSLIHK